MLTSLFAIAATYGQIQIHTEDERSSWAKPIAHRPLTRWSSSMWSRSGNRSRAVFNTNLQVGQLGEHIAGAQTLGDSIRNFISCSQYLTASSTLQSSEHTSTDRLSSRNCPPCQQFNLFLGLNKPRIHLGHRIHHPRWPLGSWFGPGSPSPTWRAMVRLLDIRWAGGRHRRESLPSYRINCSSGTTWADGIRGFAVLREQRMFMVRSMLLPGLK